MCKRQDEWLVSDSCGNYVRSFHCSGLVISFTNDREEAWRTTDSEEAWNVARVAREVYRRPLMRLGMV